MKRYLTLGSYDGVHRGHRKIIETVMRQSCRLGMKSGILFFPIPPKFYFNGNIFNCLITLPEERVKILKDMRLDFIGRLDFDSKIAGMEPGYFFQNILLGKLNMGGLCVGEDFSLGRDKKGNISVLRKLCARYKVKFKTVSFVRHRERKISSTLVRNYLACGNIREANRCLGRNYSVSGKVIEGAHMGRKLGFPTANIEAGNLKILPPGVFAVKVFWRTEKFLGVANVGVKPTMGYSLSRLLLEVHILDFDRDIYGENLRIEFLKKIRNEKKFSSRENLQSAILSDIFKARKYFRRCSTLQRILKNQHLITQ